MSLLDDPSLLDVVPWSYGFAHSWALRQFLREPRTADRLLRRLKLPRRIEDVTIEKRVGRARADVAVVLRDGRGRLRELAIETKVNDPYREEQMQAYADAKMVPAVFLPGLTGLLIEHVPPAVDGERRITGADVLAATTGVRMGRLLRGYVERLRAETVRMELARRIARGESKRRLGDGEVDGDQLLAVARLSEVYARLRGSGDEEYPPRIRVATHDRGIQLEDSWCDVGGPHSGLFVEVVAPVRGSTMKVTVKAYSEVGPKALAHAWDVAHDAGPPGDGWLGAGRRVAGESATIWTLDVSDGGVQDVTDHARRGAAWIASIADDQ